MAAFPVLKIVVYTVERVELTVPENLEVVPTTKEKAPPAVGVDLGKDH